MKYIYYCYRTTNLVNGNFYIGKHKQEFGFIDSYLGSGKVIQRAIKKYGVQNFKKEILSFHTSDEEALLEEKRILTCDVVNDKKCYNLKPGGEGGSVKGRKMTKESIDKRTKAQTGLCRSEETKQRMSTAQKGKILSEEHKQKLSLALSGENHPLYGKPCSEERKEKIRNSQSGENGYWSGKRQSDNHKTKISDSLTEYYQQNLHKTGRKVSIDGIIYPSEYGACKALKIGRREMNRRLKSDEWNNWFYVK